MSAAAAGGGGGAMDGRFGPQGAPVSATSAPGGGGGAMDGRFGLYLDVGRCVGCEACVVACMDQNDLEPERKEHAWRRVFALASEGAVAFVSLACMHCGDAPCILGCPTGALGLDGATGAVTVDGGRCIGCHSCSMACPFGVPRYGNDGRMQKCDLCATRVEQGLDPACVHTCPTRALRFGPVNDLTIDIQATAAARLARPGG